MWKNWFLSKTFDFALKVVAILKGHAKRVNRVVYHTSDEVVITASHDATIRIWDVGTSQTIKMLRIHDGPVTGLSLHATGDYILSTSSDQVMCYLTNLFASPIFLASPAFELNLLTIFYLFTMWPD